MPDYAVLHQTRLASFPYLAGRPKIVGIIQMEKEEDAWWLRWIPVVGLLVGTAALIFQITVLYPWHLELSRDLANLARSVRKH